MEQLRASLEPVINLWRASLAEELSCIEAGRTTPEHTKEYRSHRAFLDCMRAFAETKSVGLGLEAFVKTSEDIHLTKHMLFRTRGNICEEERRVCVNAINRAISERKRKAYVCRRCVIVIESFSRPKACGRCGCASVVPAMT